jgi:phospholipid/cholesterol/gamma-HCH transport system ATP-binding protein
MPEPTSILEFDNVSAAARSIHVGAVRDLRLRLGPGEIAWVALEEGREHTSLAALAQGLIEPVAGCVRFLGECWSEMGPTRQSQMRGRIRRVFEHYGWITNLDVIENLCLAEYHHTARPLDEIVEEARALARRFGLEAIPDSRPTRVNGRVLRKLEWVRALLGRPELVILERPLFGAPKDDAPRLSGAVCEATRRGTAVLWLSDDSRDLKGPELAAVRRYRMDGEQIVESGS